MASLVGKVSKLSHRQFRSMLKKFKRKKKRQKLAQDRDAVEILEQKKRENSPNFTAREADRQRNSALYDEFEERERIRKHKLWLLREEQAQVEFRKKQEVLQLETEHREVERKRILEEFEKQQLVDSQIEEENQKVQLQKEGALQAALSNLPEGEGPWHNPIAPVNYKEGGQEREPCQFFEKTGCCRYGERCSRGHTYPPVSKTILIKGMYSHFSIDQTGNDDYDTDIGLEYEEKERYRDFKDFYNDVLPEFKKYGKVIQFKVCTNFEPHLRGNVYVQFTKDADAVEAYRNFNGRFYAGKQLTCEFTHVNKWRAAMCGLHFRQSCPKGVNCNFLHVFRNPNNEFWEADRDYSNLSSVHRSQSSRSHSSRSHSERHSSRDDTSRGSERRHYYSRHDRYETESHYNKESQKKDRYESESRYSDDRSERRYRYETENRYDDKESHRKEHYESESHYTDNRSDRRDRYELGNRNDDKGSQRKEQYESESHISDERTEREERYEKDSCYDDKRSQRKEHSRRSESQAQQKRQRIDRKETEDRDNNSKSPSVDSDDSKSSHRHKKKKKKKKSKKSEKEKDSTNGE